MKGSDCMSLFLKTAKFKNGKTYLSIVDGYRSGGKVKQKVFKKLGYLDDLTKEYDDPIAHFKQEVEDLKKQFSTKVTTTFDTRLDNDFNDDTFNIGYAYLKKILRQLNISTILKDKQNSTNIKYSLTKACELLIYSRIIDPGSIKYIYEHKNQFFEPFDLSLDDLKFGYRDSIFKHRKLICLEVFLKLKEGNILDIKEKMVSNSLLRREKQPLEYPSAGSVFRNPPLMSAGKLIEDAGLKGTKVGDAMVSLKHANFIVNLGKAKGEDVIELINLIKKTVYEKTGVLLECEQEIIE